MNGKLKSPQDSTFIISQTTYIFSWVNLFNPPNYSHFLLMKHKLRRRSNLAQENKVTEPRFESRPPDSKPGPGLPASLPFSQDITAFVFDMRSQHRFNSLTWIGQRNQPTHSCCLEHPTNIPQNKNQQNLTTCSRKQASFWAGRTPSLCPHCN